MAGLVPATSIALALCRALAVSARRYTYWSDGSKRDGLATGLAAALGDGSAFSVATAGLGLAAGAAAIVGRTTGFAGVVASGSLATAATAGFDPAGGAPFVVVIDLGAGAAIADAGATGRAAAAAGSGALPDVVAGFGLMSGATAIGSGALARKIPPGDGTAVRAAAMAGLVRGSGDGRGTGTVSGNPALTRGAGSSTMIELVASWGRASRCGCGERPIDGLTASSDGSNGAATPAPGRGGATRAAERSTT